MFNVPKCHIKTKSSNLYLNLYFPSSRNDKLQKLLSNLSYAYLVDAALINVDSMMSACNYE